MILVTGASGNIGSELVKQLSAAGEKVRAGYHSLDKAVKLKGVEPVELDFGKKRTLNAALKGVDKVFLVSASTEHQGELEAHVVDAARAAEVKHLVKLSVWHASAEQYTFAKLHRAVEKQIEASGMDFTHLRPNGFMQNLPNFFAQTIKTQGAFYVPAGDSKVSVIDTRDIARVAASVLMYPGHEATAYELSGPEALSNADMARILAGVIDKPVRYVDVRPEDFKASLLELGMPEWNIDAMIDLDRFYMLGGGEEVSPAVEFISGEAPTTFEKFARDYAGSFV